MDWMHTHTPTGIRHAVSVSIHVAAATYTHDCSPSFDSFNTLWHNLYSPLSSFSTLSIHNLYLQFLRIKEEPVFSQCETECYNKFEKDGLKAAEKVAKEAIKKCQRKCDDGDKKCEKDCKKGKGVKLSEKKM